MPKRVIDFDAMWGSDKLAACADWAQAEYAWLYGLADASGCFEMTNLRVIWGRVAAVRGNFTIERLEQVLSEFQDKGLLFVWEHEGKRYAHWTGSDVPGRLPPPSWRMRLEKFAPPVPKARLAEYMARFARGRAVLGRAAFRGEDAGEARSGGKFKFEISDFKEEQNGLGGGNPNPQLRRGEPQCDGREQAGERGNLKLEISDLKFVEGKRFGDSRQEFPGAASGAESWQASESSVPAAAGKWREDCAIRPAREIRLKGRVEGDQEQDLDLESNLDLKMDAEKVLKRGSGVGRGGRHENAEKEHGTQDWNENGNSIPNQNHRSEQNENTFFLNSKASADATRAESAAAHARANSNPSVNENVNSNSKANALTGSEANAFANLNAEKTFCERTDKQFAATANAGANAVFDSGDGLRDRAANEARGAADHRMSAREIAVQKELRVGAGPVCGPVRIRPEVLERIRLREEAWARERAGKRGR